MKAYDSKRQNLLEKNKRAAGLVFFLPGTCRPVGGGGKNGKVAGRDPTYTYRLLTALPVFPAFAFLKNWGVNTL
jgi:hypothetical protein